MRIRTATHDDLDGLAATLTAAFERDPLWRWAFPDLAGLGAWWRFLVRSALRYQCISVSGDHAAAAVWIPPGGTELTAEEEEHEIEPLLRELVGPRTPDVLELLDRFEATHPRGTPHYYLSLLGVRPDHRGKGLGMALLAENLARNDAEGAPSYLESSNPANDHRYESLGFRRLGAFTTPDEAHTVATMWRDVPTD